MIVGLLIAAYLIWGRNLFSPGVKIYPTRIKNSRELQEPAKLYSKSVVLLDAASGELLYDVDAHTRRPPASLTKMMTVLVALETRPNLDQVVHVDTASYQRMVAADSSLAGFYGEEPVTVRDLLYGTMLPSGGEAASTLAICTAGSEEAFVRRMNEKAKELKMKDTQFTNPTGLDDHRQYSTAYDLAVLVREAVQNPDFRTIFTAPTYTSSATLNHPEGISFNNSILRAMGDQLSMPPVCASSAVKPATRRWPVAAGLSGDQNNREYVIITLDSPEEQLEPLGQKVDTEALSRLIP